MHFEVFDLGLKDYDSAYLFQRKIWQESKISLHTASLIFCRHLPVITLGRQSRFENILASFDELKQKGVVLKTIERGGDVTYHGPGQLTVYPIINLNCLKKDIHWYLRQLEEVVINALNGLGIDSERREGLTGVWIADKKVCSIGIAVRNWITFHGLTLNVRSSDLENFRLIRACGMDLRMTSVESEAGRSVEFSEVKERIINNFNLCFQAAGGVYGQSHIA